MATINQPPLAGIPALGLLAAGARVTTISYWNGSTWLPKSLKQWNGSTWVAANLKRWDGAAWVQV